MAAVMSETRKLTGNTRVIATIFGPRLEVEETVNAFDTNTGYSDPSFRVWRRAKNSDFRAAMEGRTDD